ncbi:conserved hypothetical protein [Ricinus communis]|uniref:Zinc knuckle CX2CX4HX4C domain-containing protein n=1 Tax=Ricinus communis TaxID=3988 RepID=B9S9Q0_RICCO|nr:conserved hypothetical protein [Ricinus communis]
MEVDYDAAGACMGRYLRVPVLINMLRPLKYGLLLDIGNEEPKKTIVISYERLPDFCYACGMLGHTYREYCLKACIRLEVCTF